MSVYFLAPILINAAQDADENLVYGRSPRAPVPCCATDVPGADHLDFRIDGTADEIRLANASTSVTQSHAADPVRDRSAEVREAGAATPEADYNFRIFRKQAASIPWRFGGAAAAITLGGFANWNWGSSRFRFNSEGWFGKDTASLGMDKLGHAYSAYVLAEFFSDGIAKSAANDRFASTTGAALAMGLMTYIEVFDGFSKDHGFSHEDLLVDAAGALFSVARRSVPGLRKKLDFRLLYVPSRSTWRALSCFPKPHCDRDGAAVRSPITDYSGQRYLLALKLSGFEQFRSTQLRFLELHTGYYARGFTKEEEDRGKPLRRRLFVGVGLDVGELLLSGRRRGLAGAAKWALQYVQIPYTAVHSN